MSTKIDLQKAYDSVHLDFLLHFLDKYGFLDLIRGWIKACIWNATFTININGSNVGFFRGMQAALPHDTLPCCYCYATSL